MLLFVDSFDNYATPAIAALGKWQTVQDANAILSIAAGQGRNGTNAFKMTGQASIGSNGSYLQSVLVTGSQPSLVVGLAVNVSAFDALNTHGLLRFLDVTTPQVTLSWLPTGQLQVTRGDSGGTVLGTSTGSVISATGSYFYIEIKITFNTLAGTIDVRAAGVPVAGLTGLTGLNTAPSGADGASVIHLGSCKPVSIAAATDTAFVDDFYVLSTTGGVNVNFLGDVRVVCVFPNGAGASTQFTPNGAAANWQCVSETSEDGDTTYVADANIGDKDLYVKQATPVTTGPIYAVQLCSVARKDDSGVRSIANTVLSGATAEDGATQALGTTYAWYLDIMESDPNTAGPWTKTTFDAAQIGVKVAA
jgi:hypothetical protein